MSPMYYYVLYWCCWRVCDVLPFLYIVNTAICASLPVKWAGGWDGSNLLREDGALMSFFILNTIAASKGFCTPDVFRPSSIKFTCARAHSLAHTNTHTHTNTYMHTYTYTHTHTHTHTHTLVTRTPSKMAVVTAAKMAVRTAVHSKDPVHHPPRGRLVRVRKGTLL